MHARYYIIRPSVYIVRHACVVSWWQITYKPGTEFEGTPFHHSSRTASFLSPHPSGQFSILHSPIVIPCLEAAWSRERCELFFSGRRNWTMWIL